MRWLCALVGGFGLLAWLALYGSDVAGGDGGTVAFGKEVSWWGEGAFDVAMGVGVWLDGSGDFNEFGGFGTYFGESGAGAEAPWG